MRVEIRKVYASKTAGVWSASVSGLVYLDNALVAAHAGVGTGKTERDSQMSAYANLRERLELGISLRKACLAELALVVSEHEEPTQ